MPTYYDAPATTNNTGMTGGGSRFGRKKKGGPVAAMAKNEMKAPGMKMVEWSSKSGERWGVARARVQEKFSRWGASMSYGMFTVTHPIHPLRRRAAKEASTQKKILAKERRVQQEAAAHSIAAGKRARARESRVATLNQGVN